MLIVPIQTLCHWIILRARSPNAIRIFARQKLVSNWNGSPPPNLIAWKLNWKNHCSCIEPASVCVCVNVCGIQLENSVHCKSIFLGRNQPHTCNHSFFSSVWPIFIAYQSIWKLAVIISSREKKLKTEKYSTRMLHTTSSHWVNCVY